LHGAGTGSRRVTAIDRVQRGHRFFLLGGRIWTGGSAAACAGGGPCAATPGHAGTPKISEWDVVLNRKHGPNYEWRQPDDLGPPEDAEPAVVGREPRSSKNRLRAPSPRRSSAMIWRSETNTAGTVKPIDVKVSISASRSCLQVSSPHVTDAPVYTLPSPTKFAHSQLHQLKLPAIRQSTHRSAAFLSSFPFTLKKGFALPRISSGALGPAPPRPAPRMRRRCTARASTNAHHREHAQLADGPAYRCETTRERQTPYHWEPEP